MHPSVALADQALDIARQEMRCLEQGDVERLARLTEMRDQLLAQAWERHDAGCYAELREKLEAMRALQGLLTEKARSLHAYLAAELKKQRKEHVRFKGYKQAAANPLTHIPAYVSKLS